MSVSPSSRSRYGSSPRMRGARTSSSRLESPPGIIPADAGSTIADKLMELGIQDHPRGCGEHFRNVTTLTISRGSSPRMRGAPGSYVALDRDMGIIPADAGSTHQDPAGQTGSGDHPRGCGEHVVRVERPELLKGSSPRMRGALTALPPYVVPDGIIPADAGSTPFSLVLYVRPWDHPRGCGEHTLSTLLAHPTMGSSPRMRGARSPVSMWRASPGIIPADAGSTQHPMNNISQE